MPADPNNPWSNLDDTTQSPAAQRSGNNGWGLAALITSIVSFIVCCGLLSPISLILSIVGMMQKHKPRGTSIAGLIISIIGVLLLIGTIIAMVVGWTFFQQGMVMGVAQQEIATHYRNTGSLPDEAAAQQMLDNAGQMFGITQYQFEYRVIDSDTYELTLPGFDEQLGTADDHVETVNLP